MATEAKPWKFDPRGAKCDACKQHMLMADGCTICLLLLKDGTRVAQIPKRLGFRHRPLPRLRDQGGPLSPSRLRRGALSGLWSAGALLRASGGREDVASTNQTKEVRRKEFHLGGALVWFSAQITSFFLIPALVKIRY